MKANYTIKTKNGKVYKWSFTEYKDKSDYGNGVYIGINFPSGDASLLDCRYVIDYEFHKECVYYLQDYYGENLDELSEDEQERLTFKRVNGKHVITYGGVEREFDSLSEAWKAVFDLKE